MERTLDVAVIGCGTAGAASALFLARAGHRVTVYEQVPDPGPVGAGIIIQPTGQAVLARLGLLGTIAAQGARIDRLRCETRERRTVVDLEYAMLDASLFGLGLHRGALFTTLYDAVRAQAGITVRLGTEITALASTPEGRFAVAADGARHGPHDLVVVADGAGSELKDDRPVPTSRRVYRWGALWSITPDPSQVYRGMLYQVVHRTEHLLGFLPTGRAPGSDVPTVSLYWSVRGDRVDALRNGGLAELKETIRRYDPRSDFVLDSIEHADQLLFARYRDVVMARFHGDRCVYLGDCAHAMSPQLGQGANLALWDAMVLAERVEREPDVPSAIASYTAHRKHHLGFYQLATRWLTPLFQSDASVLGWARDLAMPIGMAIPWVRRRMVRSMCGLELGIVRAPMLVSAVRAAIVAGS